MMLADLGADVVKIERPDGGDDTRSWGRRSSRDGASAYYLSVNRNKRSVDLDLTDPEELSVARNIARSADVVIENARAGTMERFDLDYNSLEPDNPGLIYCRISGFGPAGGRDLPGYDFIVRAASGFVSPDPHRDIARADGSMVRTVANPITLGRTPVTYRLARPELGSHTDTVTGWPLSIVRPG